MPAELPGIDIGLGLAIADGDRELYFNLLEMFREQYSDFGERFRAALESGESATAADLAHTLKGVAASIAAPTLEQAAGVLEKACREEPERLEQARLDLDRVLHDIIEGLSPRVVFHADGIQAGAARQTD